MYQFNSNFRRYSYPVGILVILVILFSLISAGCLNKVKTSTIWFCAESQLVVCALCSLTSIPPHQFVTSHVFFSRSKRFRDFVTVCLIKDYLQRPNSEQLLQVSSLIVWSTLLYIWKKKLFEKRVKMCFCVCSFIDC